MIAGKKPSIFEKLWGVRVGLTLNCLLVRWASSRAIKRPRIVTSRAASLRIGGMVIMGVLGSVMFEVISRPAIIVPHASRLTEADIAGSFSLMGERELNRGWPMETK